MWNGIGSPDISQMSTAIRNTQYTILVVGFIIGNISIDWTMRRLRGLRNIDIDNAIRSLIQSGTIAGLNLP